MSLFSWQLVLSLISVQTDTEFYFQILRNFVKICLRFPWFIILLKLGLNMTFEEKKFPSVTYSSRVLFLGSGNSEAWEWLLFNKLRCWKLVSPGWKDIFRSFFHQYFQYQFPLLTMFQLNKCGIWMDSPFKNFAKFAWKHLFLIKL